MRVLLQRVSQAGVSVSGERIAAIGQGVLALLAVYPDDTEAEVVWLVEKTLSLRIFPGDDKSMNRSVVDVAGGVLLVSQFTLAADLRRGNRPGFSKAAEPEQAERLYRMFLAELRARHEPVQAGRFGADMQVALVNDGPVTLLLERFSAT